MARQADHVKSQSFGSQSINSHQDCTTSWDRPEILLVEDGTGVFEEIGSILQEQGFQVLLAPDVLTAMEEVGNYQVDVVMTAATRQDPRGLLVLDQAKRQDPDVVTVLLTRGYGNDLPVEAYEADIDCYLGWPVLPGNLGRRLMNLLAADLLDDSPQQRSPSPGVVDHRLWFQLGRFVYEVWNSLNQASDSLNSLKEYQVDASSGETTMVQLQDLTQEITRMTDAVEQFIRETPWPELNLSETWDDHSGFFHA
jgi:DNA-binding response OmpR family regulator